MAAAGRYDIDLTLDDPEQAEPSLEEFVDRLDLGGVPYAEIVRRAMAEYKLSEATAKRRIRDCRERRAT
ncbi:hypothetical protein ACN28C_03190 [Plantactinospora sp. WMMC1484]|uniref:hypothetical protein n=1 Tax=Plantactinospora sp. WMMC1484 TaxID=3404122 RepID=UPI003BF5939B